MLRRIHKAPDNNWFLDTSGNITSVSKRISESHEITVNNYSSVSAEVDQGKKRTIKDWIQNTRHFSHQVNLILNRQHFPNILLIWIGHNNVDWTNNCTVNKIGDHKSLFNKIERQYRMAFSTELKRLLHYAATFSHQITIIVFGLVNFKYFFQARKQAEAMRLHDNNSFPYADDCYRFFNSLRSEYRNGMIELAQRLNNSLEDLIHQEYQKRRGDSYNVNLRYSDSLYNTNLSTVQSISKFDAWHPSIYGHQLLADSAYNTISEVLSSTQK